MKRTDLIALVKRVEGMKLPPGYNAEAVAQLAEFARQIAQAQPVAARYDWDGDGFLYIDSGSGSDWLTRHADAEPLYTLPLED